MRGARLSPIAQLRAEIGDTLLRAEILFRGASDQIGDPTQREKLWAALAMACNSLQRANDILGAALVKELEAAKAKEPTNGR